MYISVETASVFSMVTMLSLLLIWEHREPFFSFFVKDNRKKIRHDGINLILGGLNVLLIAMFFTGLWAATALYATKNGYGLINWLGIEGYYRLIPAIILFDFWMYLWHMMNHVVPFFWRFHKVHHSDRQMDVTTASRFHIGEIVFSSMIRIPVILVIGMELYEVLMYELIAFIVIQFHHANIKLPDKLDETLRRVIVTPDVHKVHHSNWQPETDSNYGSIFTFWDRIFRTFRVRKYPGSIQFGINEPETKGEEEITGLLKKPFKKLNE